MEFSRGMRMVQLSRTRVNSPEKSVMVERIKPLDEKVDKTVFVCKWILACQEAEVENIIEIINIAVENKNYDNTDINLMVIDTKDDVKSKENIEAVIENENDYKNESYLMVLETEVNDKRNLMVVNMENEDELSNKKNIDIDNEKENDCNRGNNLMLVNMENEDEIEKREKMYVDVSGGDVDFTVVTDTEDGINFIEQKCRRKLSIIYT